MGSNDLRKRAAWQDLSGAKAKDAESAFCKSFEQAFENTDYRVNGKPKNFDKIYVDYPLDSETKKVIYNPPKPYTKHGISPDFVIEKSTTNDTNITAITALINPLIVIYLLALFAS